jgi:hypothetical protein
LSVRIAKPCLRARLRISASFTPAVVVASSEERVLLGGMGTPPEPQGLTVSGAQIIVGHRSRSAGRYCRR